MYRKIFPYLQLMRPANLVTAMADVMAGFAISGCVGTLLFFPASINIQHPQLLFWLLLSTICLYAGGVVFNDVFDVALDKIERPERPLPSGRASLKITIVLGCLLFCAALLAAFHVSITAGFIALSIAALAVFYDKFGKHTSLGPINMGACRGLNLILGMSCSMNLWYIGFISLIYISAITLISKGEVHGGSKRNYIIAFVLYTIVILSIAAIIYLKSTYFSWSLPFLILFGYKIFSTLYIAAKTNEPKNIMKAVKTGVISLIIMNASLAAGFAGLTWGLLVLSLLPFSIYLARKFSVT